MSQTERPGGPGASYMPELRPVRGADIRNALKAGAADFMAAPLFGLFFGGIFAGGGLVILYMLTRLGMTWMVIPMAVGFPLIGPFVAVGLYEVSRRRAAGEPLTWREVLLVMVRHRERQFGYMGIVILCIFWLWVFIARILFAIFFGSGSLGGLSGFLLQAVTTAHGLGFLAIGSAIGAVFAYVLFASTVIALPMLVDRDIDLISAMITSFRLVLDNPVVMIGWGITIAVMTILAIVPAFVGLIVVLPVLGHATWHLYVAAVERHMPKKSNTPA